MRHLTPKAAAAVLALLVMLFALPGCSGSAGICASAGGTYADGTCTRHSASDVAVRQWCESHGAERTPPPDDGPRPSRAPDVWGLAVKCQEVVHPSHQWVAC